VKLPLPAIFACALAQGAAAFELERDFDTATIERLGREIYEQDRRAAIAAELVGDNFDPQAERLVGFITSGDARHLRVRFVRETDRGHQAAIDAVFDELLLPALERAAQPALDAAELAQVAARLAVARDAATRCNGRYNTVALPDPDGDGLLVYALAASDDPAAVMVGGHVRYSVSADGRTIEHTEPLATSCAVAPLADLERAARTDGSEGLALRTTLSNTPLETHVFLSLTQDLPLFVVGNDLRMWRVEAGRMQVVREGPGGNR
jgi:hypothetical protein